MKVQKKKTVKTFIASIRRKNAKRYKAKLQRKQKLLEMKAEVQKSSHSLLWVWEFSKKAVLICFFFYVIVQCYSMYVMLAYMDFSHLGELITETGEIVQNCVFAYLIKAGLENVGKIWFSRVRGDDPPEDTPDDSDPDEPVG